MINKKALIFGAGAIGRGFLAPLLQDCNYQISFVDNDKKIIKKLKKRSSYKVAITEKKNYKFQEINIQNVFHIDEIFDIKKYDIVFCCVGPNQCNKIAHMFKNAKTVISCENDIFSVDNLKKISGNKNVFFGIPDVITSNTASKKLLKIDDLMTVTEKGILILQKGNYKLPKKISQVSKSFLEIHWRAKLFIHNAPHAILAYLGFLKGYKYIHEAMNDKKIKKVIEGAMNEITKGIVNSGYVPKNFAQNYKKKEIKRFSNNLLFDPILRVAREPLRKLGKENRIVLAVRVAQWNNKFPKNTTIGIKAALNFFHKSDPESVYLQKLRKKMEDSKVLEKICGIEQSDPLNNFCLNQDLKAVIKK
jgi:mannitol-1-phosphate 5-dehydrogenase